MRSWLFRGCMAVMVTGCAAGTPGAGAVRPLESAAPPYAAASSSKASSPAAPPDAGAASLAAREELVDLARTFLGKKKVRLHGRTFGDDCTGLVRGVYSQLGVPLLEDAQPGDNGVTAIFRFAQHHGRVFFGGRPLPGDLVFFRETYDQNRDGRVNDGLTHVGIVENVSEDGTVNVIHRVRSGVVRYHMNLDHPELRTDPKTGHALNDYLRVPGPGTKLTLTGQLFASYASIIPTRAKDLSADHLPVLRPQPEGGSI